MGSFGADAGSSATVFSAKVPGKGWKVVVCLERFGAAVWSGSSGFRGKP